jgi:hypothetical protein
MKRKRVMKRTDKTIIGRDGRVFMPWNASIRRFYMSRNYSLFALAMYWQRVCHVDTQINQVDTYDGVTADGCNGASRPIQQQRIYPLLRAVSFIVIEMGSQLANPTLTTRALVEDALTAHCKRQKLTNSTAQNQSFVSHELKRGLVEGRGLIHVL